jgi:hypothetical protein
MVLAASIGIGKNQLRSNHSLADKPRKEPVLVENPEPDLAANLALLII